MKTIGASYMKRLAFASRYAGRHLLISTLVALIAAGIVYGWWYPSPFRQVLDINHIFLLMLVVDVVCGPLLTLIISSPNKSSRERLLDFSLIGLVQLLALAYGLHSVWLARPAVLAFEVDRLVVVTANEINHENLSKAPEGLRQLPFSGVMKVATRRSANAAEMFESVELDTAGLSPAKRPSRWEPWDQHQADIKARCRPLTALISQRPKQAAVLKKAAAETGLDIEQLTYLPLTSSKTKDAVALFDANLHLVGYAPVDGFQHTN